MASRSITSSLAITALLAVLSLDGAAQERQRADIPVQYTWNLGDIYPSVDAWRAAKNHVGAGIPSLKRFAGRLETSAATLADALEATSALAKEFSRVSSYASFLADQDTRESVPQGLKQELSLLGTEFSSAVVYMDPEILGFKKGTIARFIAAERRLAPYAFFLHNLERRAPHMLSRPEEEILALTGPMADAPSEIFSILLNADFPSPTVTLANGQAVKVNQANFALHRTSGTRADRQTVMAAFFQSLGAFSRTFATIMNGNLQRQLFSAKARHYATTMEAALDGPNIPVSVYSRLVDAVNKNLGTFHRYLRLRKRMLGLDELRYYDLYAPLVGSVPLTYSPDDAQRLILAAMAPLGTEYTSALNRALTERWIDLFPSAGKAPGAYSASVGPDVHPFMLLNFNGRYIDVSTLAHELGHTMQTYYSNRTQPYPMAGYPIFVAEVASTFNEALLIDHLLKTVRDDSVRLALLGNYVENIKQNVFRQVQFAEFERAMHEMAAAGEPVTGDSLGRRYLDITRKYYGQKEGVAVVDDYIQHEWSFVPHFYSRFYVYQYATSLTAATALAEKVESGDPRALARYLAFISAGGSKYPIDLLKDAGVDMTTDEPLTLTMKKMNEALDQMESILTRQPATSR